VCQIGLSQFLSHPAVHIINGAQALAPSSDEIGVYDRIKQRKFQSALNQLETVVGTVSEPLNRSDVDLTILREATKYTFLGPIGKDLGLDAL
jgi:hypothetical protein